MAPVRYYHRPHREKCTPHPEGCTPNREKCTPHPEKCTLHTFLCGVYTPPGGVYTFLCGRTPSGWVYTFCVHFDLPQRGSCTSPVHSIGGASVEHEIAGHRIYVLASAGPKWVLLVLQRCAHSRNRPTATDEITRKIFSILVAIFPVGTISGNRQNCCHQMSYFKAKMHQIQFRMVLR